jgi:RNA recognition motif-containing protein
MGMKLYVGNLAYSVTSESLEQMFLEFGTVTSAQVIQDRETGRSKGFGFVEMQTDDAAQRAISGMHGKDFGGRPLTVNEAKPRESGGGGGGGGRGGYGGGGGGRRY